MQTKKVDIIIMGGGMVGSAMALGAVKKGFNVAIIEPKLPDKFEASDAPDARVSAISLGSEHFLDSIGAWSYIKATRSRRYNKLSVSENEGKTSFTAEEAEVVHLGHIIENRLIQLGIHHAIAEVNDSDRVSWYKQGSLECAQTGKIKVEDDLTLQGSLIVAADGANSSLRKACHIGTTGWQYEQQVLALTVELSSDAGDHTWQQFTSSGPRAYLPLFGNFASLVWYASGEEIDNLIALPTEHLMATLSQQYPNLVVDFTVLQKARFPIQRMHAQSYSLGRVVLVGDAAHAINPLAGQGVNIGFQDVMQLLSILSNDLCNKQQVLDALQQYETKRRPQNLLMMSAMDVFYLAFSNDNSLLKVIRNAGLSLADKSGFVKKEVLKHALGI